MSSSKAQVPRSYVIRDTTSMVFFFVAVAVLAVVTGDPLVRGNIAFFFFVLPLTLLASWVMWFFLYRPRIRYDSARALVINFGREHSLPWAHVTSVRQRLNVVLDVDDGRSITAFGATASRGPGVVVRGVQGRGSDDSTEFNRTADTLDAMRTSAIHSEAPIVSRWEPIPLGIGAVLIVASVIDLAVAISAHAAF